MLFSLVGRCALHRLDPWAYLHELFARTGSHPVNRVLDLSPAAVARLGGFPAWAPARHAAARKVALAGALHAMSSLACLAYNASKLHRAAMA